MCASYCDCSISLRRQGYTRQIIAARKRHHGMLQPSPKLLPETLSPERESFTWSTFIPSKESQSFSSSLYETKGLENCKLKFSIQTCIIDSTTHVDITIFKTNIKPVRAQVNVCFIQNDIQHIEIANSWTENLKMKRLPLPQLPHDYSFHGDSSDEDKEYDIFFEITWLNSAMSLEEPEPPNLYNDLGKFLTDSTFSDATIVIENEEIQVHKIILCSCSSVFHDMFTNPMKEKLENRVEITDFKADTVKIVLKFIYTGNYEALDDVDTALDTLAFAQKYNMIKLKEICEYQLSNYLTLDNVLNILNEADDHSAADLEQKCLEFMTINRELMKNQPELKKLCIEKPVLIYMFLQSVL